MINKRALFSNAPQNINSLYWLLFFITLIFCSAFIVSHFSKRILVPQDFKIQDYYYKSKHNVPIHRKVTAVFIFNSQDNTQLILSTFFNFSTFSYENVICVKNGNQNQNLTKIMDKYKQYQIRWIITGRKSNDIQLIDTVYSLIQTPYIFHSNGQWTFSKTGFIEQSLWRMEFDPKLLSLWLGKDKLKGDSDSEKSQTIKQFSFGPGLLRMKQYEQIFKNFKQFTQKRKQQIKNISQVQNIVSNYFYETGRYILIAKEQYIQNIHDKKIIHQSNNDIF